MKNYILIFRVLIFILSLSSCGVINHDYSNENQIDLYETIWRRENFPMPSKLSDYEIDYAMRTGLEPRSDETYKTISTEYTFLCGKLDSKFNKMNPAKILNTLEYIENTWGKTAWSEDFKKSKNLKTTNHSAISTYLHLRRIKSARIVQKSWDP